MSDMFVWVRNSSGDELMVTAVPFGLGPRVSADEMIRDLALDLSPWELVHPTTLRKKHVPILIDFGCFGDSWPPFDTGTHFWIDCLMWARRQLPPGTASADIVIAERFFESNPGVVQQARCYKKARPPICKPSSAGAKERKGIAISFGGVATPYSSLDSVLDHLATALLAVVNATEDNIPLMCGTPEPVASELRRKLGRHGKLINSDLNNREFEAHLASSEAAVLQAGLYGPFSCLALGTPLILVPPFSYSQHLQLQRFADEVPILNTPYLRSLLAQVERPPEDFTHEAQWTARLEHWWSNEQAAIGTMLREAVIHEQEQRPFRTFSSWAPSAWNKLPSVSEIVATFLEI